MTNKTVATGGVLYADEGPYTIDVRHLCLASIAKLCDGGLEENVEEMVGTTRERRVATESTGDETGGPGDETSDKTAGDE